MTLTRSAGAIGWNKELESEIIFYRIYRYMSCLHRIQTYPIGPLADSIIVSPKVLPLSSLTLITGTSLVSFVSHHVTTTLSASESISTLVESIFFQVYLISKSFSCICRCSEQYFVITCLVCPPRYVNIVSSNSWWCGCGCSFSLFWCDYHLCLMYNYRSHRNLITPIIERRTFSTH